MPQEDHDFEQVFKPGIGETNFSKLRVLLMNSIMKFWGKLSWILSKHSETIYDG